MIDFIIFIDLKIIENTRKKAKTLIRVLFLSGNTTKKSV